MVTDRVTCDYVFRDGNTVTQCNAPRVVETPSGEGFCVEHAPSNAAPAKRVSRRNMIDHLMHAAWGAGYRFGRARPDDDGNEDVPRMVEDCEAIRRQEDQGEAERKRLADLYHAAALAAWESDVEAAVKHADLARELIARGGLDQGSDASIEDEVARTYRRLRALQAIEAERDKARHAARRLLDPAEADAALRRADELLAKYEPQGGGE